jgi:hypothetical protein
MNGETKACFSLIFGKALEDWAQELGFSFISAIIASHTAT